MTQEQLAREAGVTLRTVQGWCAGRALPRWGQLVAVACVLGRAPGWFYAEQPVEDGGEATA
jgi:transcriptional regulator with XRE-family HTH domain